MTTDSSKFVIENVPLAILNCFVVSNFGPLRMPSD
jgi:hypothetical protein